MSRRAQEIFVGSADLWLSFASIWEILIKAQSGKLRFPCPAGPYVLRRMEENGIAALPITLDHLLSIERLPMHHRDPFDRMLIAQSMEQDCPILTADPMFQKYSIQLIW